MTPKQFLIGLGLTILCGAAVFLTSPSSWPLLNMMFGAQPTTMILADGSTETSIIGPKSPWPDWALKPEGATVTVRSSGLGSNGVASGHAAFKIEASAGELQIAYARRLESAGWKTRLSVIAVTPPEIAPRMSRICVAEGEKDGLSLRVSADAWTSKPTRGAIFWRTEPSPPLIGAVEGAC